MSASNAISPVDPQSGGGYGSGSGASEEGKSPLSLGVGFLKNLTEKKSVRADGQSPKRRGPKPDSKPALTRRQELNRQAQRTHRERKELYIKALEQEVLRLKETFSTATQDKERLAEENRQLKSLLAQHGITWNGTGGVDKIQVRGSAGTSSSNISGSYAPPSTTYSPVPQLEPHSTASTPTFPPAEQGSGSSLRHRQHQPNIDLDQAGIDFVLTLERPCMEHMQFLVQGSDEGDLDFCGHALMASCPPYPGHDAMQIPFGHNLRHDAGMAQKTWDVSKPDLANLMDLSKRLNLDGEITPVMAWGMILAHKRFEELNESDFKVVCQELRRKVRCYGFGAVLEEFEVRDALDGVFFAKP